MSHCGRQRDFSAAQDCATLQKHPAQLEVLPFAANLWHGWLLEQYVAFVSSRVFDHDDAGRTVGYGRAGEDLNGLPRANLSCEALPTCGDLTNEL